MSLITVAQTRVASMNKYAGASPEIDLDNTREAVESLLDVI